MCYNEGAVYNPVPGKGVGFETTFCVLTWLETGVPGPPAWREVIQSVPRPYVCAPQPRLDWVAGRPDWVSLADPARAQTTPERSLP